MTFDIRHVMEHMKGALTRGDEELHRIWDEIVPELDKAAVIGARLAESPLAAPVEALLGLPPTAHDMIAKLLQVLADDLGKLVPQPVPVPPADEPPAEQPDNPVVPEVSG
jgi:hypothetical protein